MKTIKKAVFFLLIFCAITGCEENPEQYDFEKYKFVSFIDQGDVVPETYTTDNETAYPIYLRYDGSVLTEDFTVNLTVSGNHSESGIDYEAANTSVLFKAGEIKSEPLNVTIVNNLFNSTEERTVVFEIESISNPNISIGVGIVNQSNTLFTMIISDDECSETIAIFESSAILSSEGDKTVIGHVSGTTITLVGDLINYSPFSDAELGITLTPTIEGGTSGTTSFEPYDSGTDDDGYVYQFRQNGEGSFDICAGTIIIAIDVYYESGGSWSYWKTTNNVFSLP